MNIWKMKVDFWKKLLCGDKKTILISIIMISILALVIYSLISNQEPLNVVESIEPELYLGEWYSVYEIPVYYGFWPFGYDSTSCVSPKAEYSLNTDGTIKVLNSCLRNGEPTSVEGTARFKTPDNPNGELFVKFFFFESDYNILGLGENYEWAVVGTLSRNGLWFLSRTESITQTQYDEMLLIAQNNGFDTTRLVETK